jgi:outer membrane protein assembly factor BamB
MNSYPTLRRTLSLVLTAIVFGGVIALVASQRSGTDNAQAAPDQPKTNLAQTWHMWGGSNQRNMVNTWDKNVPIEWDVEKKDKIKWVAQLGTNSHGGPVFANGKIFVGTNNQFPRDPRYTVKNKDTGKVLPVDKGILMCFRESDGQFLWQAVHDKLPSGIVNDWGLYGVCSTPAVDGNNLYYVCNRCEVICADTEGNPAAKEAKINWKLEMMKELNVFPHNSSTSSPLVVGDLVYCLTSNGVDEGHLNIPSPKAPSFIAVDKKKGTVVWTSNLPGEKIMHGQWSSPVYGVIGGKPQVIFPGGDGWIYAFEPTKGTLLWKFDCNPKNSKYVLGGKGTKNDFISTPVVYDNKVYIGVGQDPEHREGVGHLWCIDPTKASPQNIDLSPVKDNFDPKAAVNKNSGLVWHYGGMAPPGSDPPFVFGRTMSTCAIHDGLLYVAELAGYIHCLDAKTGQKYWDHYLKADVWGSPYWVDNKVYIGTDEGNVFVFAHGKEKKLLATNDMGKLVRSTPIVSNGVLYVMTVTHLYAIK